MTYVNGRARLEGEKVPKAYVNKGNKKMHFEGGCRLAEGKSGTNEVFASLSEARRKYGDAISVCRLCEKKFNEQKSL